MAYTKIENKILDKILTPPPMKKSKNEDGFEENIRSESPP